MQDDSTSEVAYIVKEFPLPSETFIANEIHLLESMGLNLRIYSIMRVEESKVNGVIALIRAPVTYLPASVGSHLRLMARRPRAYFATLARAIVMSWKYRRGALAPPRKVFVKEFLQAGEIAVQVLDSPTVRHLHGHNCHGTATVTWFVSHLTGLPFSFTAHAKDIYKTDLNPGDLLRRKMMAARFVATCSAANHRHLSEVCPEYRELHTVYHGLDINYFVPQPRPNKNAAPVILSVGRFVEKKGFEYLIAACAQLKAAGLNFYCWLVGPEGSHSQHVQQTIEMLGVSDIVSTNGAVTQAQLRHLYRHASIFVLPGLQLDDGDRDGIPDVLAEAMAMGIPVVSTEISGISELIENGTNGLLVPQRDSRSLARAIQALIDSPELRLGLGQEGRNTVCRNFDSRRTTSRLKDLFLAAIQGSGPLPQAHGE
jgi:glycosyltransferase involved in cell wall biosynthesis